MKTEHAYVATNRNQDFLKAYLKTRKLELNGGWEMQTEQETEQRSDFSEMFEVHGHSTLHVHMISTPIKKKMLSAVKKGYAQAHNGLWPAMLRFLSIQSGMNMQIPIGYLGKSQFLMWIANDGGFDERYDELMALITLAGDFKASSLSLPNSPSRGRNMSYGIPLIEGYQAVECNLKYDELKESKNGFANHLMTHFTQVRHLLDRFMAEQREARQPLIDLINSDAKIEVPFSTKK